MHIKAYTYDEFTYFDDLVYEISKKMILEKVNTPNLFKKGHLSVHLLLYHSHGDQVRWNRKHE